MKKKHPLLKALALMLLASALTCLIIALTLGQSLGLFQGRFPALREHAALLSKIEEYYIGEYDETDITVAANNAAVDALGDRWSYYLTAEEYVRYLDATGNRFTGIGVLAEKDEETGGMLIRSVYRGSAAETGGLVAGDIVTDIDGNDITGIDFDEMREMLARPVGDKVSLTVLRADASIELIEVIYSIVFTDPVTYEMLDGSIGYIRLANFESGAANSLIAAVGELIDQGAEGLVFDVRGNGGGRVSEMTRILDHLLPEGEIFIAVDRSGKEEITTSGASNVDIPCAVLVDRYSFSAAEYFAATLKEYDYAVIVGEQTTGKDRSQVTIPLPSGGALHISSAKFLTKNRVSLYETGGLTPDYPVAMTEEEFTLFMSDSLEKDADPQLACAMELLR